LIHGLSIQVIVEHHLMNESLDLIKAVRSGRLEAVRALLDAGIPAELADGQGDPGLPMGVACFMGFVDIVRELAARGARVNLPDNSLPTSPLSMALRGQRTEVVRALIELGAEIPEGTKTGLSEQEVLVAQWKACKASEAANGAGDQPLVEEIDMVGCFGTDTQVLEADVLRAAAQRRS
jgi:ankyrin repeat protein